MGYIGNQTSNSYSSLDKQTITGDGGTGYTLDHAVANAQEIEVFVNNVRQEPGVAYTVSGTTLTMTGNVASTDDFYVVFQGKALQTTVPPDDSVTTARINNDAVTNAKIADDAVDTAQIAANAVTSAKMFSGFANGMSEIDIWVPTPTSDYWELGSGIGDISTTTSDYGRWATNWEKVGTGMTQSGGIFTFPSTGKYRVVFSAYLYAHGGTRAYMGAVIAFTTNNSTYNTISQNYGAGPNGHHAQVQTTAYLDITDTANQKVKFTKHSDGTHRIYAGNAATPDIVRTYFSFEKLSDT